MIESVAPGVKARQQTAGASPAIFANTRTLASWETGRAGEARDKDCPLRHRGSRGRS